MPCDPKCTHCHPEGLAPGRPGWEVTPGGHRRRVLPGGGCLAVVPPGGPGRAWFWTSSDASGREALLEDAQLAAERAAIPLLRAAADELERGLPGPRYCEHGPVDQCGICRPDAVMP